MKRILSSLVLLAAVAENAGSGGGGRRMLMAPAEENAGSGGAAPALTNAETLLKEAIEVHRSTADLLRVTTERSKGAEPTYHVGPGAAAITPDALAKRALPPGFLSRGVVGFARHIRALALGQHRAMTGKEALNEESLARKFGLKADDLKQLRSVDDAWYTQPEKRTTQQSEAGAYGGSLLMESYGEFVSVLRSQVAMLLAGVPTVTMDSRTMKFPRQTADAAGSWVEENESFSIGALTTDAFQLELKKWGCIVPITEELLADAGNMAVDELVAQSLIEQALRALDYAGIRGLGVAGVPKGLRYFAESASQVTASAAGSGSNTLTTAQSDLIGSLATKLSTANVPNVSSAVYLMHPRTEGGLQQLRDGTGLPFYAANMENGKLLNKRYFTSTQIPTTLSGGGSGGSAESEITLFVPEQFRIGMGVAPQIDVSNQASWVDGATQVNAFQKGLVAIRLFQRVDVAALHNEGAAVVKAVTLS